MLQAIDLTCAYEGRVVFKELYLDVQPGQVLALVGPNGVGKSTLLRAMARLLRPLHGRVLLDGSDLWQTPPRQAARQLALAPQASNANWPITVGEMVALARAPHRGWLLPLTHHDRQAVHTALEQTGMVDLRDRRLNELSGGERQRAVLARVLAQEPQVLLLDEPTSHLDLKYQSEILGRVQGLAHDRGLAVIVSLHDLNMAALYADRMALLAERGLLAVGTPAEVLTPERLSEVYGVEVVVAPHPLYGTPLVMPALERKVC